MKKLSKKKKKKKAKEMVENGEVQESLGTGDGGIGGKGVTERMNIGNRHA